MPYIKHARRMALVKHDYPKNPGELNYAVTVEIHRYLKHHGLNYQSINDIKGALVGALDEFTRRVVNPYEDQKIDENGDVYDESYDPPRPTASSKR